MGLESEDPTYATNTDALRILGEAYPGYGNPGYATNQFYGLTNVEPFGITRQNHDNPRFAWPQKEHMDQSGRTYTIQRGYMRSLLTDPAVSQNSSVPNRRVFFQFNPLVLQREVQQSVGTMMPLLQDPAQLVQPIPGTTQFSFQLMFNREHEVNKGINDVDQEWLKLPSGQKALVSEIGVLADLMMLDSITGQGLSEDMITALVANTKRQYQNYNTIITNAKEKDKEAGIDVEENAKDYKTIDLPKDDVEMSELFNANIGNSAFLNPLPFRVMFSSLFMVEGVATSVSVSFNKFSKTMVPTQCVVTINMYALYLGFAKKKTFIYDNLIQESETQSENSTADDTVQNSLNVFVEKVKAKAYRDGDNNLRFEVKDIKKSKTVETEIKTNRITDVRFTFQMQAKFHHTESDITLPDIADASLVALVQKDKSSKADHPYTTNKVKGLYPDTDIFKEQLGKDEDGYPYPPDGNAGVTTYNEYVTFRIIVRVTGKSPSGNVLTSSPIVLTTIRNLHWTENDSESKDSEYELSYTASSGYTYQPGR